MPFVPTPFVPTATHFHEFISILHLDLDFARRVYYYGLLNVVSWPLVTDKRIGTSKKQRQR